MKLKLCPQSFRQSSLEPPEAQDFLSVTCAVTENAFGSPHIPRRRTCPAC